MIPREKLNQMRTNILDEFAIFEHLIEVVILNHYFGETNFDFAIEVLHDEQFSFALRRNILEKILRKKKWYDDDQFQNFHKLGKIRNKFAHLGPSLFDPQKRKFRFPEPKFPEKDVYYEKEYVKFKESIFKAIDYLLDIFKKMGISDKKNK